MIRHALGCYDALQGGAIVGLIVGYGQLPTVGRRGGSPAIIHSPSELRSHARRGEKPVNFARFAAGALQRTVTGLTNRKSTEPMPDEVGDAALPH